MDQYYYRYDTAKGVKLVAFGFLLLFLDFNIISDTFYIDILPDALGLLLFLMSVRYLEGYVKNPTKLRILSALLILEDVAEWLFTMSERNSDLSVNSNDVRFIFFLASFLYLALYYIILGAMIRVAEDFRSYREHSIRVLRFVMIVIQFAISILIVSEAEANSSLTLLVVIAGCIAGIVNLIVLFGLKKDVEHAPAPVFDEFAAPDEV